MYRRAMEILEGSLGADHWRTRAVQKELENLVD
jgi:hypothetical protein